MCAPKPKIVSNTAAEPKDPAIIRNSYLDGIDPKTRSARSGRGSLRIPKSSTRPSAPAVGIAPPPKNTPIAAIPGGIPKPAPAGGGGSRGGGGGRFVTENNVALY